MPQHRDYHQGDSTLSLIKKIGTLSLNTELKKIYIFNLHDVVHCNQLRILSPISRSEWRVQEIFIHVRRVFETRNSFWLTYGRDVQFSSLAGEPESWPPCTASHSSPWPCTWHKFTDYQGIVERQIINDKITTLEILWNCICIFVESPFLRLKEQTNWKR